MGKRLTAIRDGALYIGDGHSSWSEYCRSDRVQFSKRRADQLIRAADYFDALPAPSQRGEAVGTFVPTWTEGSIWPLIRMPTRQGAVRVARKIAAHLRTTKDARLTERLVTTYVDEDLGVARERSKKLKAKLEDAQPHKALAALVRFTREHRVILEMQDEGFWQDAVAAEENEIHGAAHEVQGLADLLKARLDK